MKILTVFFVLAVLFTLAGCGDDFDAEAEKEAVFAVSKGIDDHWADADREAILAVIHDDFTMFSTYPDTYDSLTLQDFGPDAFTQPWIEFWNDYDVLVSSDLAVIIGNRIDQVGTHSYGTAVFEKEDGEWKLIHFHGSYAGQ